MLRLNRDTKQLVRLPYKKMAEAGLLERADIQRMIRLSADEFFADLGEHLLLIGEEVMPADIVADRIDLLAVDSEGALVVIELKRSNDKLQLLQALSYAAMISKWNGEQIRNLFQAFRSSSAEAADSALDDLLDSPGSVINTVQRIILVAEDYDYEVLVTAEWLSERFNVDIKCFRLSLSVDGTNEYLSANCVYPPPEIAEQVKKRSRGINTAATYSSWDQALALVKNAGIARFVREQLAKPCQSALGTDPRLKFLSVRGLRYNFHPRPDFAYVWQHGRFDNDVEFWSTRIKAAPDATPMSGGKDLRLYIRSFDDCLRFVDALAEGSSPTVVPEKAS
jgi:hypothetical protein